MFLDLFVAEMWDLKLDIIISMKILNKTLWFSIFCKRETANDKSNLFVKIASMDILRININKF